MLSDVSFQAQFPVYRLALDRSPVREERGDRGPLYVRRVSLGFLDEPDQKLSVLFGPTGMDLFLVWHWNGFTIKDCYLLISGFWKILKQIIIRILIFQIFTMQSRFVLQIIK